MEISMNWTNWKKRRKLIGPVQISERSIQILDEKGRILKRLTKENEEAVWALLELKSNSNDISSF